MVDWEVEEVDERERLRGRAMEEEEEDTVESEKRWGVN